MAFREKSAWLMLVVLLLVGGYVAYTGFSYYLTAQEVPPFLPIVIQLTVSLIAFSVIGQIVLGIAHRRTASEPADERERLITQRGQAVAGFVLAFAIITSLLHYMFHLNGDLLFFSCLISLVLAQVFEYAVQIIGYRRGH
ncbi:hypothetical protein PSI9734_01213 [Pseudidiomarina piscicola]|uniref:DUF2178 domain-containing protein n=1 Tax=Pseudidiomarina piscicola TaxID=2614830 RepID=A0A6S6WJF2_9GAMM|nr:hypothetical protein [Pseudidiomarina piscicola]CAB0150774.1 hypothetical protein PSI9734_01213 [Pseudidiomarina piscicola]VZT40277.1 hypothetical protein PSI9734_01213 [Pseudomonas aeruginosa]